MIRAVAILVALSATEVAAAESDRIVPESGDSFFRHHGNISWLAFMPSGMQVVSCGNDKLVRMWDVGEHRLIAEHLFPSTPSIINCDETGLILFEKQSGFVEFDSETLKPLEKNTSTPALQFLSQIHEANPGPYRQVSKLWRLKNGAFVCTYGRRFCFAPRPDTTTWSELELGDHVAAFAQSGMVVAYSDESIRANKVGLGNRNRHVICQRFDLEGNHSIVLKIPYPENHNYYSSSLSDDGSTLACLWERVDSGPANTAHDTYILDVYRVVDQFHLGRLEYASRPPLMVHFTLDGARLLIGCHQSLAEYVIDDSRVAERRRIADSLLAASAMTSCRSLGAVALHTHGHGFAVLDLNDPQIDRLTNAVDWQALGVLGDDTLLIQSVSHVRTVSLPGIANGTPQIQFSRSFPFALSDDRRSLIYASNDNKVSIWQGTGPLVRDRPILGPMPDAMAISGNGELWATGTKSLVRIFQEQRDKSFIEAHSFDSGTRIRRIVLSADGQFLLVLGESQGASNCAIYRAGANEWKVACGPFDFKPIVWDAVFAAGDCAVSIGVARTEQPNSQQSIMETRRIDGDLAIDLSNVDNTSHLCRQIGKATRVPLLQGRRLCFRDVTSHKQEATALVFGQSEIPQLAYRDLGLVVVALADGRLAVRSIDAE